MLSPRLIPTLLLRNDGLVKTCGFSSPKYVGDPVNAVRIFNEKEVDELILIDIDASKSNTSPNFDLIERIAAQCQMPLCYAGGVKDIGAVETLIRLGVEKVAIGHFFDFDDDWVLRASKKVGSQSLTGIVNVAWDKIVKDYVVVDTVSGAIRGQLFHVLDQMLKQNIGEILLHNVDRDGTMEGYNLELFKSVREYVDLPITILGGAGNLGHFKSLIQLDPYVGCAAGSFFVFKGRMRAVLLSYPAFDERKNWVQLNINNQ